MEQEIVIVSVVRDFGMYETCVRDNPCLAGCRLVCIDNREQNRPVPVCYNEFLSSDSSGWLVFCHEDWQVLEPLQPVLERLDPAHIYGPIGVFIEERPFCDHLLVRGTVRQSGKDGVNPVLVRGLEPEGRVDTLDCQCLIVHASLVARAGLRFDERFAFDMYVEDFCAAAFEKAGILTYAIPLDCLHRSAGRIARPFRQALRYVREKYPVSRKRYATIVGHLNTFGRHPHKPVRKIKK